MENEQKPRVALVTGASSGIGAATAILLQQEGWEVYGLSRSGRVPAGVHALLADVSETEELQAALESLWQSRPQLDLVVHAAGIGGAGSVENYPIKEARKVIDTNFLGTLFVAQACLPLLRRQGGGTLIFVSSVAGLMGIPFHGIYAASKFAVEGLLESLRMELLGTGVRAVSVCPGDTATPIIDNQYRARREDLAPVYRTNYQRAETAMAQSVADGIPATVVAARILRIAENKAPNVRYSVGDWLQWIAPLVKRILPMRWFEQLMIRYYGLTSASE